jgi:polyisoprenoid-binding protein YceI
MTTVLTALRIPAGTWTADPIHSNAGFEVEHGGISIFRGSFKPVEATLDAGDGGVELAIAVPVESISTDFEMMRAHLLAPEFFDVERNPQIRFRATDIVGDAADLTVVGDLEMAGVTRRIGAHGHMRGPATDHMGNTKLGFDVEATIDRTDFGMNWQTELPGGGTVLANTVKLIVTLELGTG